MKPRKNNNRWIEKIPEGQQPSDDAVRKIVAQDEDRFLAARDRAVQSLAEETSEPSGKPAWVQLGWSAAAMAAIACVVFFAMKANPIDVPRLIATPAVANYMSGIEGWVYSSHDLRPVCGVEVYARLKGNTGLGRLIDITDSYGAFHVASSDSADPVTLSFLYDGTKIDQIVMDRDLHDSMGYEKVLINLPPEKISQAAEVQLNPGETKEVFVGVQITLASEATQPWSGSAVLDRNWLGHFAYSQCLEGLLQLEGPESEHLEITLTINAEKLKLFRTNVNDLKVITYSEVYRTSQKEDDATNWRSKAHNGWFDIADEYLLGLDQATSGVQYQTPKLMQASDSVTVSWSPTVGDKYAVLTQVQSDGKAVVCWYSCFRDDVHRWYPTIKLIDRTRPVSSLFEYRYYPEDEEGYYTDPSMLDRNKSDFSFWTGKMTRNHADANKGFISILENLSYAKHPGEFQLVRYDFSLSKPHEYAKVELDFSTRPGDYEIAVERKPVGESTTLTVTGDVDRLAKRPEWDFYGDFIHDKFGLTTTFRPTHTGEYNYNVILEEKCGNVVILERVVRFPAPWVVGYKNIESVEPVIFGAPKQPSEVSSLTAYSEYAVSSPAAYGVETGTTAGPLLCIDPPEDFRGVALAELTVHLYARGVAGDFRQMPLNAHVSAVRKLETVDEFKLWQFEYNYEFSQFQKMIGDTRLDPGRLSWETHQIIRALNKPGSKYTATSLLQNEIISLNNPCWSQFYMDKLGIDFENLEPEDQLFQKLIAFGKNPYLCINYATHETTDLVSKMELYGGVMEPDDFILVRVKMEDAALPVAGQWELYSGGEYPSRVELEAADGRVFTTYFDYAPLSE